MSNSDGEDCAILCSIILLIAGLFAICAATAYFTEPDPETAARGSEAGAQLGGL